jgi:hypothetical protein
MKAPSSLKDKENNKHENSDFQWFGQRLWADIFVTDDEAEWQVVRLSKGEDSSPTTPTSPDHVANAEDKEVEPSAVAFEENTKEQEQVKAVEDVDVVTVEDVEEGEEEGEEKKEAKTEVRPPFSSAPPEEVKWIKELTTLREMGFFDGEVIIPLLESHLRDGDSAEVKAEAMQNVVITLLSQAGFLH